MTRYWRGCIGLYALATVCALAQNDRPESDWATLRTLPADSRINVTLQDGKFVHGRFVAWSSETIDIGSKKGIVTLRSGQVRRVTVRQKASRWKGAMFGALTGFAIAFPLGAAWAGHITDRNNPGFATRAGMGAGMGIFAAGIGAPLGALAGGSKDVTVFRAKDRP